MQALVRGKDWITNQSMNVLFLFVFLLHFASAGALDGFNFEIEKRLLDHLHNHFGVAPIQINKVVHDFRENGGFPHRLKPLDRDLYLIYAFSMTHPLLYYALEDGSISGYYFNQGYYREPGNSGYDIDDPNFSHHLRSCVSESGEPEDCLLQPGTRFIQCIDDCALVPCPDELSQRNCSDLSSITEEECLQQQKWCPNYKIETATESSENATTTNKGFVPLTNFCHDRHGHFSEEVGGVIPVDRSGGTTGNCYFGDGKTLVQRNLSGPYAYCGENGEVCDTTFVGGYESNQYDPRYRPFYTQTKQLQRPNWLSPFPFFTLGIGITYSQPIYDKLEDGRDVFAGIVALDYTLDDITKFLIDNYGDSTTVVAIFEDAEPHYLIATSTGSDAAQYHLTNSPTIPCPVRSGNEVPCTPVRVAMSELSGNPVDRILVEAFARHKQLGFRKELIGVRATEELDSDFYTSQVTLYEQAGANLKWRIIVASPGRRGRNDSITVGTVLFPVICSIAGLGFVICMVMLIVFVRKRKAAAIIHSDWRFTSAFILGCAFLNLSSFTLLSSNTDMMCLLRSWSFHLLLTTTLAPLFVKVWRMHRLVGQRKLRRTKINNMKAALCALPIILAQVAILTAFTIFDPPRQVEVVVVEGNFAIQHVVCRSDSYGLFIVEAMFDFLLVFVGCILAYLTRNMDPRFGEAKLLLFTMYNIALSGIVLITPIFIKSNSIEPNGFGLLQVIAVFWVTTISALTFVLPRLIKVRKDNQRTPSMKRNAHVVLSGVVPRSSSDAPMSLHMESDGEPQMVGEDQSYDGDQELSVSAQDDLRTMEQSKMSTRDEANPSEIFLQTEAQEGTCSFDSSRQP